MNAGKHNLDLEKSTFNMKPQLILGDDPGRHNIDLNKSAARVISSGTYKRQRVVMVIPAIAPIPPRIYLSHRSLISPPNQGFLPILAYGDEVGVAYSSAIEGILAHPDLSSWEYLLTLESDNSPPPDGLLKLIERMKNNPQFAAISGLYWCKGESGCAQIWGDVSDPVINFRPQPPRPGELVECVGLGMGFCLWKLDTFKDSRLRRPWFKTLVGSGGVSTQDLYAWTDLRKYGYRAAVDCGCLVGHLDSVNDIMW